MSVQEKKDEQGYIEKHPTCNKCTHRVSVKHVGFPGTKLEYSVEKNMKCGIGGFAVKKTASCDNFKHESCPSK